MTKRMDRREFVVTGAAAGVAAAITAPLRGQAPAMIARSAKPAVVASANGNMFKNGGPVTCVEKAFQMMTGGADVLDAVIAGVNIVELDPLDTSVGYGGLPNADGVVQLDSCCMHGPKKRAGAVAALEGVRTPSRVARAVMEETGHHLLAGRGAQDFARARDGEVDAGKMAEIDRIVGQLIKGEMFGLILNFEAVEHVNFSILPALVEEKKRLQSFGGDLRLAALSDYLKNIFKTTGVLDEFQSFETAQQAGPRASG